MTPEVFKFSILRDDRGWGQTIFIWVYHRGGICLAVMKRVASSDTAAEDMANLMIWSRVSVASLLAGMEEYS